MIRTRAEFLYPSKVENVQKWYSYFVEMLVTEEENIYIPDEDH